VTISIPPRRNNQSRYGKHAPKGSKKRSFCRRPGGGASPPFFVLGHRLRRPLCARLPKCRLLLGVYPPRLSDGLTIVMLGGSS